MAGQTYTIAEKAVLTTYLATPNREAPRPAVIVLPGGGWIGTSPSEGECVALAYLAQGFQAFVLDYSTLKSNPGGCAYPQPLLELAESIRLVKTHAQEWHVDPNRIFVLGFSAGGFICASYGNRWQWLAEQLGCDVEETRVAGTVLCYPAVDPVMLYDTIHRMAAAVDLNDITGDQTSVRLADFERATKMGLFGKVDVSEDEIRAVSAYEHLGPDTLPAFIWGTYLDGIIDPRQLYRYGERLCELGISHELHLFETGPHGMSLANEQSAHVPENVIPNLQAWLPLSLAWMRRH